MNENLSGPMISKESTRKYSFKRSAEEDTSCAPLKVQTIYFRHEHLKMERQTNCVLCEYKSKNLGSLRQHMESKHNVLTNMTVIQVLTQQVERVNDLEKELKTKEELLK